MHQASTELSVYLPDWRPELDPASSDVPVLPVIPLAIMPERNLAVGNDGCAPETVNHEALGSVTLFNRAAMLHWRGISNAGPTRTGEAVCRIGDCLPAEPVGNEICSAARGGSAKPISVRVGCAHTDNADAEQFVDSDASARLNLVVVRVAFAVNQSVKLHVRGDRHRVMPPGVDHRRLLEVPLGNHIVLFHWAIRTIGAPHLPRKPNRIEKGALFRVRRTLLPLGAWDKAKQPQQHHGCGGRREDEFRIFFHIVSGLVTLHGEPRVNPLLANYYTPEGGQKHATVDQPH